MLYHMNNYIERGNKDTLHWALQDYSELSTSKLELTSKAKFRESRETKSPADHLLL